MHSIFRKKCPVCRKKSFIYLKKKNAQFCGGYKKQVFKADIYDCLNCKARFIMPYNAETVHEQIHLEAAKNPEQRLHYSSLIELGERCADSYRSGDRNAYRKLLAGEKYRFLIDYIEGHIDRKSRLLEVGCAEGYLTGYFALEGYDVTGMDISETAVSFCKENYGEFFLAGDIRELKKRKYDVIYHAGLIGEIDFPKEFLYTCIDMLNGDGIMVFNVPNRFRLPDGEWTETQPPDLRTLFTADSFRKLIDRNDVEIEFQYSISGRRCSLSNPFLRIWETVMDWLNYVCYIDRNSYNLYIIIKKKREKT